MAARPHAPSQQRIAEARASGHVPRVSMLGSLGLIGSIVVGSTQDFGLVALWERALAGQDVSAQLRSIGATLGWCALAVWLLILIVSLLAQGPSFVSQRKEFAPLRVDRTAGALFALCITGLSCAFVADAVRLELNASWLWILALVSAACLVVDIALARARWFASLWMTRREYKDEQRDQGPAPEILAARKRARR
jgi:flagellar biosynthesis protein FlhB